MKKQMKIALFGGLILLLAACGQVQPVSTAEPVVTQSLADSATDPAGGAVPESVGKYVGLNYPPLPAGLSTDIGMLIQDAEAYSLSLISDGTNKMLWLSKMTHRDGGGNAFWEVTDVLDLSDLEAGTNLLLDGCSLNGAPDHEIFVVAREESVILAWRANTTSSLFEEIPTTGIECHSDKVVPF